mgnify:CR=1 FL=1
MNEEIDRPILKFCPNGEILWFKNPGLPPIVISDHKMLCIALMDFLTSTSTFTNISLDKIDPILWKEYENIKFHKLDS